MTENSTNVKIWHQATMVLDNFPAFARSLAAHFKKVARPGTEVVLHGTHPATYKTSYPGADIRYFFVQQLISLQFALAAVAAEDQGFDVFAISTLPDYGLGEARSVVEIPVVGYSESAMLLACMLGRRFGVLVFIEELAELVRENAHRYGFAQRLSGVRPVEVDFAAITEAFNDPTRVIEKLTYASRALIREGAEAIIPGEAPLCVLLAQNGISSIDGVPIVDALGATIKMAETMVDLRRTAGMHVCRRGYFGATLPRPRLEELIEFYGLSPLRPPYKSP